MDKYSFIDELHQYCINNSVVFVLGSSYYTSADLADGLEQSKLVLVTDCVPLPTFGRNNASVQSVTYTGRILLGRKSELTTMATLDENMLQKYYNRLKELWELLELHLTTFACANKLNVVVTQSYQLTNFLAENVDFVGYDVKIEV